MKSITGRLSQVSENMFIGYSTKVMSVECLAMFGEHVFDSRKVNVKRADSAAQVGAYSGSAGSGSGYSTNPYSAPGSSDPYSSSAGNPYLRDPSRSVSGSNPYYGESGSDDDQVKTDPMNSLNLAPQQIADASVCQTIFRQIRLDGVLQWHELS